jgi:hypothetical protein
MAHRDWFLTGRLLTWLPGTTHGPTHGSGVEKNRIASPEKAVLTGSLPEAGAARLATYRFTTETQCSTAAAAS